jgi:hypothetical protein
MCPDITIHDLLPQNQWLAHIPKKRQSKESAKIKHGVESSSDMPWYLCKSYLIAIPICTCLLCPAYKVESNNAWLMLGAVLVSQGRLCTNTTGAALKMVDAKVGVLDTVNPYTGKLVKWLGAGSRKPSGEESGISVMVPAGSEGQNQPKSRQGNLFENCPVF